MTAIMTAFWSDRQVIYLPRASSDFRMQIPIITLPLTLHSLTNKKLLMFVEEINIGGNVRLQNSHIEKQV